MAGEGSTTIWRGGELIHKLREPDFASRRFFPVTRDGNRAVFELGIRGKVISAERRMSAGLPAENSILLIEKGPDGKWLRTFLNCGGQEVTGLAAVSEGDRLSLLAWLRRPPPHGDDGTEAMEWAVLTWKDRREPWEKLPLSESSLLLLFRK